VIPKFLALWQALEIRDCNAEATCGKLQLAPFKKFNWRNAKVKRVDVYTRSQVPMCSGAKCAATPHYEHAQREHSLVSEALVQGHWA